MPKPTRHVAKDGKVTYYVRFRNPPGRTGRNLQETFDTLRDAKAFCSDIDTRDAAYALRVLHEREREDTQTLDAIAAQFFEWKATRVRSDRTVADYRRDWDNHISPTLGHRKAGSITEADVQEWVDGLGKPNDKGHKLSPKTIRDYHALLSAVYGWALHPTRHLVDRSPTGETDLPAKRQKPQPKGLRPGEWAALHAAMTKIDPDGADLALFLLASGWRISEAAAVTAWDVEDYGNALYVSMGHVLRRTAAGTHVVVDEGKGEASLRRVQLDAEAAAVVRRRLEKVRDGGLVFTTKTGAQWHTDNFRSRIWRPAVKAANLTRKPTPHWLRHTAVFWLNLAGASLPEIQSRIGHAHISTTVDVYGSMLTDVSPAALDGFAAMRAGRDPRQIQN